MCSFIMIVCSFDPLLSLMMLSFPYAVAFEDADGARGR